MANSFIPGNLEARPLLDFYSQEAFEANLDVAVRNSSSRPVFYIGCKGGNFYPVTHQSEGSLATAIYRPDGVEMGRNSAMLVPVDVHDTVTNRITDEETAMAFCRRDGEERLARYKQDVLAGMPSQKAVFAAAFEPFRPYPSHSGGLLKHQKLK